MYGYFHDFGDGDYPYTDLACERRRAGTEIEGVDYKKEVALTGRWERLRISSECGARSIGRPKGIYDTLELLRMDLLTEEDRADATDELARELCYLLDMEDAAPDRILVVGLGNPALTPDAIGPAAAAAVKPTLHISDGDRDFFCELECSEIAVTTPGVCSASGMDSFTTVKGICDGIRPSAIIAIDSLAARSAERLGTTVQLSSTGIHPGSGLGGKQRAINKDSLGVPVIAIGVPTVIDARMFWLDAQRGSDTITPPEGIRRSMFVCPKEIGEIVSAAAVIIGGAINQAFGLYC